MQGSQFKRPNSFDKVAQQNEYLHHNNHYPFASGNEDIETHSAMSSGNHSAWSEGDLYQAAIHQPHMNQSNYMGYSGYGGIPSNRAAYGFTP